MKIEFNQSLLTKCLYPKLMCRLDNEGWYFFYVACKKCMQCKKAIAKQWAERILFEYTHFKGNSYFLTLTYNDECCPDKLSKEHFIKFMKRYRKSLKGKKIKYFACGEYGETTQRPHYHAIILGDFPEDLYLLDGYSKYSSNKINKLWKFGSNQIGSCTSKSIHYVTGYVLKNINKEGFRLMSKGMGAAYAIENAEALKRAYLKGNQSLPKYICNKINISEEEISEKNSTAVLDSIEKLKSKNLIEWKDRIENSRSFREALIQQKEQNREKKKL